MVYVWDGARDRSGARKKCTKRSTTMNGILDYCCAPSSLHKCVLARYTQVTLVRQATMARVELTIITAVRSRGPTGGAALRKHPASDQTKPPAPDEQCIRPSALKG